MKVDSVNSRILDQIKIGSTERSIQLGSVQFKALLKDYRVDRQCLFFRNPPGIHLESTFWKVAKIIGKSSTSEKPFEGGFQVDSQPFSIRFRYWFSNFLKVDSHPFSNTDLATFQDFELDLEQVYQQVYQRR